MAFVVAPDWQGTGLGSALQRRLVEHARTRGLRALVGEILPQNKRMIELARRATERYEIAREDDTVRVTMWL
ncbi:MAG: GNAT family N-acetyltransferase [Rubrivivax sp.]|nr:GNAT family N-acetyltransferase [Rubrivivax sp.]